MPAPSHTCGNGKMLKQLDEPSSPLCRLRCLRGPAVQLVGFFLFFPLLWEAGKFRIEEILILAVQQTTKPYSDHLKFVQFVEFPSVACIFPVQFLLVVFIWSKLK